MNTSLRSTLALLFLLSCASGAVEKPAVQPGDGTPIATKLAPGRNVMGQKTATISMEKVAADAYKRFEQLSWEEKPNVRRLFLDTFKDLYTGLPVPDLLLNYDYLPGEDNLNPLEQQLLNEDPATGYRVLFDATAAMLAAELAYNPEVLHNGNGDAFRHTLWNYLMVKDVGESWAIRWANAHEDGGPNQPQIEREMDLWNNQVGRNIGTSGQGSYELVKESVRSGVCRRIVGGILVPSNREGES